METDLFSLQPSATTSKVFPEPPNPALEASKSETEELGREVIPEAAEGLSALPGMEMEKNTADRTGENLIAGIENRQKDPNSIRVFMLLFPQQEFTKVEAQLVQLRKRFGFDNNSQVCKKLIEEASKA